MKKRVSDFALRSFFAQKSKSVKHVYENKITKVEDILLENGEVYYVGVKDTDVIPSFYLEELEKNGFLIHTKDVMSDRGRAIDLELINPITGRFMSGSSSGTAINVFRGVNDLGIGTDGGGSVLAPALALNLYGMISPLICSSELSLYSKKSTDNIVFRPSIGFIAKHLEIIDEVFHINEEETTAKPLNVLVANTANKYQDDIRDQFITNIKLPVSHVNLSYASSSRNQLMEDLNAIDFDHNILVSFEGPVDLFEYGDSLSGHYSEYSLEQQQKAYKYYLKVINMLNLSAIIVPSASNATGTLLVCKSEMSHINTMLKLAYMLQFERSELEARYFDINYKEKL